LNKQQVWNHKKYCSVQCSADARFGEKTEWNGVLIRPGKALEVLKLCCAGMTPEQACQTAGAERSAIKRLKMIPEAAELLSKRACPICGKDVPPPLNRKYCSKKCCQNAKYERSLEAKGIKKRFIDYEGRRKTLELYQGGLDCCFIAQHLGIPKQRVENWAHHSKVTKSAEISPEMAALRPLRRQLEDAKTADEWAELLRNSISVAERSNRVMLVCARLHGSGAPGRYIGIASEQYWHEDFYDGVCVAFCNILKNAITTIEWRGENFHLTRTFKTSGTFVWPDEKLGRSIEVTRAAFEHLISLKKTHRNADTACIHADFVV
jgi:hypothetical protein